VFRRVGGTPNYGTRQIVLVKTVQNQHEHIIGRVVMIVRICCFLDLEPFGPLHLHLHVITMILRFFPQPDSSQPDSQKRWSEKAKPNRLFALSFVALSSQSTIDHASPGPITCPLASPSHRRPCAPPPASRA
jgi:hypothetical protein